MKKKKNSLFALAGRFSNWNANLLIAGVRFYQRQISPGLKPACRYLPTCSQYTIEALREWGPIRGSFLGLWRILRCHPLAAQRVDEVPRRRSAS
ncbi:MAG: membrane protein insertion efficiency factor YidD [Spirochaetia bacterium]|nr:membrane protein insertion efficiency factor YidD [Spirochaetia bacterium]